jgi:hypothetical protein
METLAGDNLAKPCGVASTLSAAMQASFAFSEPEPAAAPQPQRAPSQGVGETSVESTAREFQIAVLPDDDAVLFNILILNGTRFQSQRGFAEIGAGLNFDLSGPQRFALTEVADTSVVIQVMPPFTEVVRVEGEFQDPGRRCAEEVVRDSEAGLLLTFFPGFCLRN